MTINANGTRNGIGRDLILSEPLSKVELAVVSSLLSMPMAELLLTEPLLDTGSYSMV
ncbi:hypothetical protein PC129_g4711 [Phytophthora cactorum]|uniref:Uncharacterized protein n=1 Tax=Phytophthora cactorum TaxID=29920 RepID=A0A8T0ZDJ2_9STRA|nr:hypothetical protein PC111_g393 [Phytophthora cactorum]KAG2860335.1 hypothetical protein PC113_g8147 [Phytophthora cactorum]KAG3035775.1 hypothetical protein PC119_g4482 [Phytophthora cactorum]KAG3224645.1 hypothetical protein PC129_g4711 [Phytophthora cactorum]KAG4250858.1 hypothetical protein PC116_g1471 [Phytophthora cactorum]